MSYADDFDPTPVKDAVGAILDSVRPSWLSLSVLAEAITEATGYSGDWIEARPDYYAGNGRYVSCVLEVPIDEERNDWRVHGAYKLSIGNPCVCLEETNWESGREGVIVEFWEEDDPVEAVLRFVRQMRVTPSCANPANFDEAGLIIEPVPPHLSPLEFATLALVDAHENRGLLDPSTAADRLVEAMAAELGVWGGLIDGRCVVKAQSRFSVSTVERAAGNQIVAVTYRLWLDADGGLCELVTQTREVETAATLWTECDPVAAVKRYVETLKERL